MAIMTITTTYQRFCPVVQQCQVSIAGNEGLTLDMRGYDISHDTFMIFIDNQTVKAGP